MHKAKARLSITMVRKQAFLATRNKSWHYPSTTRIP